MYASAQTAHSRVESSRRAKAVSRNAAQQRRSSAVRVGEPVPALCCHHPCTIAPPSRTFCVDVAFFVVVVLSSAICWFCISVVALYAACSPSLVFVSCFSLLALPAPSHFLILEPAWTACNRASCAPASPWSLCGLDHHPPSPSSYHYCPSFTIRCSLSSASL